MYISKKIYKITVNVSIIILATTCVADTALQRNNKSFKRQNLILMYDIINCLDKNEVVITRLAMPV